MNTQICLGCGVELPSCEGPVHRYMESSAACWARYGELLAREYQSSEYMPAHRLTVDAYAVQHPGRPSPQSIQSVNVHLISLHAVLQLGFDHRRATSLIRHSVESGGFIWLEPPVKHADLTVLHPLATTSPHEHVMAVREWALAVWRSWADHHVQVRAWAERVRE
jgi:hypothetical protein